MPWFYACDEPPNNTTPENLHTFFRPPFGFDLNLSNKIHQNAKLSRYRSVFALWSLHLIFPRNPKCRKGMHQTPDSESGPWESHPCRVLRQLRREVSLSPEPVMAVSVATGYFGNSFGVAPHLMSRRCLQRPVDHGVPSCGLGLSPRLR